VAVDRFPLTSNGKVDRLALAHMPVGKCANQHGALPASEAERKIARIWETALGVEKIKRTDSFFDLGGNSLTAIRIVSEIQASLNAPVTVMDLFEFPTVQLLAAQAASTPAPVPQTTVQNRAELRQTMRRGKPRSRSRQASDPHFGARAQDDY
jgi:acyl carrier protein